MYLYKGQQIPQISDDKSVYYNLRTNRKIQKGDPSHHKIDINLFTHKTDDPRIYGTTEEILGFQEENKTILGNIKLLGNPPSFEEPGISEVKEVESPPKYCVPYIPKNAYIPVPASNYMGVSLLKPSSCITLNPPLPFENLIVPISTPAMLPVVQIEEKDDFFPQTKNMNILSFIGLKGKGKIIKIINYNTINLLVYVQLGDLMRQRNKKILIVGKEILKEQGFFTILPIRLANIQHSKNRQAVKRVVSEFYKDIKIVYYNFIGYDRNGRTIARLYEDKECKKSLNDKLNITLNAIHSNLNDHISNSINCIRPQIPSLKPFNMNPFLAEKIYSKKDLKNFIDYESESEEDFSCDSNEDEGEGEESEDESEVSD